MRRFLVNYFVGRSLRQATIEAPDLETAEQKANVEFTSWVDVVHSKPIYGEPAYRER